MKCDGILAVVIFARLLVTTAISCWSRFQKGWTYWYQVYQGCPVTVAVTTNTTTAVYATLSFYLTVR